MTPYSLDGFLAGVVYKSIVKKIVYQWKYQPFVSDITSSMSELLYESLIQQESWHALIQKDLLVTSVPLSRQKKNFRGYNHADLLGQQLAKRAKLTFVPDIILRTKHTKAQFELGKAERYKNVKDAFVLQPKYAKKLKQKTIILIDDVATTFSTLRSCGKVLKRAGAKNVWGVTFTREE